MNKFLTALKKAFAWIGADGIQHVAVTAIVVFMFAAFCPLWLACVVGLAVGIAKEAFDVYRAHESGTQYDWKHSAHDLICDCIGVVLGVCVCLLWLFIKAR